MSESLQSTDPAGYRTVVTGMVCGYQLEREGSWPALLNFYFRGWSYNTAGKLLVSYITDLDLISGIPYGSLSPAGSDPEHC